MIAWLTHHLPREADEIGGIPGKYRGGAEMSDAAYLDSPPEKVDVFSSKDWEKVLDYDEIIITGTDLLTSTAMIRLAEKQPKVLVHHQQTQTVARKQLLDAAKVLICRSPRHLELELAWTQPQKATWIPSSLDVSEITLKDKENFALWASRLHYQKGPDNAIAWAEKNQIPLTMYWNKPRDFVLEAMSRAKHFVFLPNSFDAEPRVVIEAVLSGCEVHTNDQAGISSIPNWQDPEVLMPLIAGAKEAFWQTVMD